VLGLFFGKDGIRLLGDYKVSFIAAESCFVLSVFWGYLVLGSLAGSQDKGTYNVHRTATRIISWFQIVTYLIGAGLFVTLLLTLPEPPNPDSKHSTFTTALGLVPELGGPYAIGGGAIPESNQVKTKLAEFEAFHATMWGFSKVEVLSPELFKKSVARNKVSGVPYTEKYQRYNYVVRAVDDDELQILVAIWSWPSEEGEEATFGKICKKRNAEESLASAYATATVGQGVMVNFFPEDTDLPSAQSQNSRLKSSPCSIKYIDVRGTVKFTGVLDASGKHFMLAQGSGTYLEAYPSVKKKEIDKSELTQTIGRDWVQTKVLYAGEIHRRRQGM
jgi:hypothetical protein